MSSYDVEFGSAAARQFKKLPEGVRSRIRPALESLAVDAAQAGRIAGKRVKTLHGVEGEFHRLRVGDYRIMYDVRVILVLGVVHRGDLERWLRNR